MAIPDKEFRELSNSVAEIRGTLKTVSVLVGVLGGFASLVLISALGWCWHLSGKVTAMEQQLADGGNTKLVAQLNKPASPQQLIAGLSTVVAQVQTAQANGTKPDPKKVDALSAALSNVVTEQPNLPEAWQAAAQLIAYRSSYVSLRNASPPCASATNRATVVIRGGPATADMWGDVSFSNCTLDLDQSDLWTSNNSSAHVVGSDGGIVSNWHLVLSNVIVHYTGTPLTHVSRITFDHCAFDFHLQTAPAPNGQHLTERLLAADDIKIISVDIPSAQS